MRYATGFRDFCSSIPYRFQRMNYRFEQDYPTAYPWIKSAATLPFRIPRMITSGVSTLASKAIDTDSKSTDDSSKKSSDDSSSTPPTSKTTSSDTEESTKYDRYLVHTSGATNTCLPHAIAISMVVLSQTGSDDDKKHLATVFEKLRPLLNQQPKSFKAFKSKYYHETSSSTDDDGNADGDATKNLEATSFDDLAKLPMEESQKRIGFALRQILSDYFKNHSGNEDVKMHKDATLNRIASAFMDHYLPNKSLPHEFSGMTFIADKFKQISEGADEKFEPKPDDMEFRQFLMLNPPPSKKGSADGKPWFDPSQLQPNTPEAQHFQNLQKNYPRYKKVKTWWAAEGYNAYIDELSKPGVMLGEDTLRALVNHLEFNYEILSPDGKPKDKNNQHKNKPNLVFHYNGVHYSAVVNQDQRKKFNLDKSDKCKLSTSPFDVNDISVQNRGKPEATTQEFMSTFSSNYKGLKPELLPESLKDYSIEFSKQDGSTCSLTLTKKIESKDKDGKATTTEKKITVKLSEKTEGTDTLTSVSVSGCEDERQAVALAALKFGIRYSGGQTDLKAMQTAILGKTLHLTNPIPDNQKMWEEELLKYGFNVKYKDEPIKINEKSKKAANADAKDVKEDKTKLGTVASVVNGALSAVQTHAALNVAQNGVLPLALSTVPSLAWSAHDAIKAVWNKDKKAFVAAINPVNKSRAIGTAIPVVFHGLPMFWQVGRASASRTYQAMKNIPIVGSYVIEPIVQNVVKPVLTRSGAILSSGYEMLPSSQRAYEVAGSGYEMASSIPYVGAPIRGIATGLGALGSFIGASYNSIAQLVAPITEPADKWVATTAPKARQVVEQGTGISLVDSSKGNSQQLAQLFTSAAAAQFHNSIALQLNALQYSETFAPNPSNPKAANPMVYAVLQNRWAHAGAVTATYAHGGYKTYQQVATSIKIVEKCLAGDWAAAIPLCVYVAYTLYGDIQKYKATKKHAGTRKAIQDFAVEKVLGIGSYFLWNGVPTIMPPTPDPIDVSKLKAPAIERNGQSFASTFDDIDDRMQQDSMSSPVMHHKMPDPIDLSTSTSSMQTITSPLASQTSLGQSLSSSMGAQTTSSSTLKQTATLPAASVISQLPPSWPTPSDLQTSSRSFTSMSVQTPPPSSSVHLDDSSTLLTMPKTHSGASSALTIPQSGVLDISAHATRSAEPAGSGFGYFDSSHATGRNLTGSQSLQPKFETGGRRVHDLVQDLSVTPSNSSKFNVSSFSLAPIATMAVGAAIGDPSYAASAGLLVQAAASSELSRPALIGCYLGLLGTTQALNLVGVSLGFPVGNALALAGTVATAYFVNPSMTDTAIANSDPVLLEDHHLTNSTLPVDSFGQYALIDPAYQQCETLQDGAGAQSAMEVGMTFVNSTMPLVIASVAGPSGLAFYAALNMAADVVQSETARDLGSRALVRLEDSWQRLPDTGATQFASKTFHQTVDRATKMGSKLWNRIPSWRNRTHSSPDVIPTEAPRV